MKFADFPNEEQHGQITGRLYDRRSKWKIGQNLGYAKNSSFEKRRPTEALRRSSSI